MYTMNDLVVYILIAALVYYVLPLVIAMLDSPQQEGFAVIKPTERFIKSSFHTFRRAMLRLWKDMKKLNDRMWRDMKKL